MISSSSSAYNSILWYNNINFKGSVSKAANETLFLRLHSVCPSVYQFVFPRAVSFEHFYVVIITPYYKNVKSIKWKEEPYIGNVLFSGTERNFYKMYRFYF